MANQKETICIVGAGIAGISCAIALAESHACKNKNIVVFEGQQKVGGRANTIHVNGHFIDLGSARFSPQIHKNVYRLVSELGIEYEEFPFTHLKHPHAAHKNLKDTLSRLKKYAQEDSDMPFKDFLVKHLGESLTEQVMIALGYDSLLLPNITPLIAYDIIEKHPEIQGFSDNSGGQWNNLTKGFFELTRVLYEKAKNLGVTFLFDHKLLNMDTDSKTASLTFKRNGTDLIKIHSQHCILTLPPSALSKLSCYFPEAWSQCTYGSIPLFKGFLFYENPWWQSSSLTNHVVIAKNHLRKIYFKSDKYIFFYTDSHNAEYWHELYSNGESSYLDTIKTCLSDALHIPASDIPDPIAHAPKYWKQGVEFVQETSVKHPACLSYGQSNIISTSDAYTAHCGWMEGGIIAGESAAQTLIARLSESVFALPQKKYAFTPNKRSTNFY